MTETAAHIDPPEELVAKLRARLDEAGVGNARWRMSASNLLARIAMEHFNPAPTEEERRQQLETERQAIFDEMDARDRRLDEIRDELAGFPA